MEKEVFVFPTSFAQQRLWFLDQLEPGNSAYSIPAAFHLTGSLHVEALERSLNEILARHEALRTSFSSQDGQPVQVIAPTLRLALPVTDLTSPPEAEREAEALRLTEQEARRPFDLAQAPLLRAGLLRLAEDKHILLLAVHHIVSDGWSMGILLRELSALYNAFCSGKPSPLAPLPIQYADFAVWQRQWLDGETLERQLSYWRNQLEGMPRVLELPTDQTRPALQTFHGAHESLILPPPLTEAIRSLSRREGTTLFMTLLGAFQTLLYRLTGQDDIVVGSPIAGRNRAEIEPLIGFFINSLVLRTDLSGNPSFRELLSRVRRTALDAYAHQDLPFERLVEELRPERDLSRTPLFQVFFNMVNLDSERLRLNGVTAKPIAASASTSKFDLTLYVREEPQRIHFKLVYNAELFAQLRMAEMLEQLKHLLQQIVEAPNRAIRSLSLVTPRSAHLLPDPAAVLSEPPCESVTSLVLSWAHRTPHRIAIRQEERAWTYEELSASADAIARLLAAHGTQRGEVVAVTGPKSFGLVSSMMAAFLSGGTLCPIDPNLPSDRQRLMLREAGAKRLLYVGAWRKEDEWMQKLFEPDILAVREDEGRVRQVESLPNIEATRLPELSPNDAAYVFFTSGTTGVPKTVSGNHKGLSHFLTWQKETFAVGPEDRSAQLTALSFDVVLRDIFLPLISGSTLCLPKGIDEFVSHDVLPWLDRERVTLLHTVPSLAQSWLATVPPAVTLRTLRWVFFAGEPLTESLVRQWRKAFPDCGRIVNLYGPTETTLAKCFYTVPAAIRSGVQPVGRPLPQTQALVLQEKGQLCGIGEPGEIALRTPFRSLGYGNAPEEQRKRFVVNPHRDDSLDLIYRTGDRGRYLPDGSLEILGRLDDQVKIRGLRVEPDEVTAILSQHPGVRSCVVAARKNEHGETILVGYVVAASDSRRAEVAELRSFLARAVPSAMVPSSFVFLDRLPLTPNGKVDRRALPAPDPTRPDLEQAFVAPRSPLEETLADIWRNVLGIDRIGVDDNFFDLGGHSLLATQVVSRIRKTLHIELPLRALFENPTVASLAAQITQIQASRSAPKMADLLDDLESISEEEARLRLCQENSKEI